MTRAIADDASVYSAYSDCFKSEYGFRPRWPVTIDEARAWLEGYEARLPQLVEQWREEEAEFEAWIAEQEAESEALRIAAIEAEADALEAQLVRMASRRRPYVLPVHAR